PPPPPPPLIPLTLDIFKNAIENKADLYKLQFYISDKTIINAVSGGKYQIPWGKSYLDAGARHSEITIPAQLRVMLSNFDNTNTEKPTLELQIEPPTDTSPGITLHFTAKIWQGTVPSKNFFFLDLIPKDGAETIKDQDITYHVKYTGAVPPYLLLRVEFGDNMQSRNAQGVEVGKISYRYNNMEYSFYTTAYSPSESYGDEMLFVRTAKGIIAKDAQAGVLRLPSPKEMTETEDTERTAWTAKDVIAEDTETSVLRLPSESHKPIVPNTAVIAASATGAFMP
ncbi:MAG: hypothetical protein LBT01_02845, partial [Spirochaetaceae bacterium]|nr:hypothetical protein [Spirochaetaceae bacterium]